MQVNPEFITLLVAIVGLIIGAWRWTKRIETCLTLQGYSIKNVLTFQETLVSILSKSQLLKPEEYREIVTTLFHGHQKIADAAIESLKGGNPLTKDEVGRLVRYRNKLAHKEDFTADEAQDFHALIHKANDEHPELPGLHILLAIATLLVGYHAGRENQQAKTKPITSQDVTSG